MARLCSIIANEDLPCIRLSGKGCTPIHVWLSRGHITLASSSRMIEIRFISVHCRGFNISCRGFNTCTPPMFAHP